MEKAIAKDDSFTLGAWHILCTSKTQLEIPNILVDTAEGREVGELAVGAKIWSDRTYNFSMMPEYMDGLPYVLTGINTGSTTYTAKDGGYAYVMIPIGIANSQQGTLEAAGWKQVNTFGLTKHTNGVTGNVLDSNISEEIALMEKAIAKDDSFTLGAWHILFTSKTQLDLSEPPAEAGILVDTAEGRMEGILADGVVIFGNRTHTFDDIPEYMEGLPYILSNIGATDTTTYTANADGYAYVLAPTSGDNSQASVLENAGWTKVYTYGVKQYEPTTEYPTARTASVLSIDLNEELALLERKLTKGDSFTVGSWGVLFTSETKLELPDEEETNPADASLLAPDIIKNPGDKLEEHPEYATYLDGNRQWQGIASMAKDNESGRLWYAWYSGGYGENERATLEDEFNFVLLYTSGDDGATWSGPQVVIDPSEPGVRAFDPNPWVDPNGRLWLFWAQSYTYYDGRAGVWSMYTDNPESENPTWSEPKRITHGIAMCDPVVLSKDAGDLKAGTWMLPTAIWNFGGHPAMEGVEDLAYPNCFISTDEGMTWTYRGSVKDFSVARHHDENMIVQQSDGTLKMWIRTAPSIQQSFSTDGGLTWSKTENSNATNVCARAYIGTLEEGVQLAVFNDPPNGGTSRNYLTAALSYDDGKTWPYKLLVDERGEISYPDVHVDDEGYIYISYDRNRYSDQEMWFAKITKEDILAGEVVSEGSKLRVLVNSNEKVIPPFDVQIEEELAVLKSDDKIDVFTTESLLWTDRDYKPNSYVPKQLIGMGYVCGSLNNGGSFTVEKDGWVYILTPDSGGGNQTAYLEGQGFTKQCLLPTHQFSDGVDEELNLMQKQVKAGEAYTVPKWGIVFAAAPTGVTGVKLDKAQATIDAKQAATLQLTATVEHNKGEDLTVVWSSSEEAVATVDENGLVTAVSDGNAVITVTTNDGGFTATCTVTVKNKDLVDAEAARKEAEEAQAKAEAAQKEAEEAQAKAEAAQKEAEEAQAKAEAEAAAKVEVAEKAAAEAKAKQEAAEKAAAEAKAKQEAAEKAAAEAKAKQEAAEKALEELKKEEKPTEPSEPEKAENPFVDIAEDMFCYDAVLWAYENKITTGKDETHFNPSGDCTRAQVVTFLWRAAGEPEPKDAKVSFPDVAEGKYYTKAVAWAVENGITAGYKDGTFGPDDTCTRGQIVTFLWRAAGKNEPTEEKSFPDVAADKFYSEAVLWAVENGITSGYKDGTFGPDKTCTRDQIVTFLYRSFKPV